MYDVRLVLYPTVIPRARGRRTDAAGLAKTACGIVNCGMYVVIVVDSAEASKDV